MAQNKLEISIASPSDREKLVAEIFFDKEQFAELNQENGILTLEFYPRKDGEFWRLDFDQAINSLVEARQKLIGE